MTRAFSFSLLAATVLMVGCNQSSPSAQQKKTLPATTAEVVRQDITGYQFIDGKVFSPPGTSAELKSPYTVPIAEVYVRVGERIRKGDPIAKMDMPGADESVAMAQSHYNSAKSAYDAALSSNTSVSEAREARKMARQAEADAKADVLNGGTSDVAAATQERIFAEQRLKDAQSEAGNATIAEKMALDSAGEYLSAAKSGVREGILRSPITGTVIQLEAKAGMRAEANQSLAVVCDLTKLEVQGTIPAEHSELAKKGQPVLIALEGSDAEPIDGEILDASVLPPSEGQASSGYLAVIDFKSSENAIMPGTKIKRIGLRTGKAEDALVVPVAAIVLDENKTSIAYVRSGSDWVARPVELGLSDGALIQVKSGIKEGEIVQVQERTVAL